MNDMKRRELLGMMAGSGAAIGAVVLGMPSIANAKSKSKGKGKGKGNEHGDDDPETHDDHQETSALEVVPDLLKFDSARELALGETYPTGPFYIEGPIYAQGSLDPTGVPLPTAILIGLFRSWGWIVDPLTGHGVVNQSFEIDGKGSIQLQGSDSEKRAVTGGTGKFRNARGEATIAPIDPASLAFRATFCFRGAGHV